MTKKYKIVRDFTEGEDGEVTTLYDEENIKIMSGDYYHDKIDDKIDGFFEALGYLGIKYETVTEHINEEESE